MEIRPNHQQLDALERRRQAERSSARRDAPSPPSEGAAGGREGVLSLSLEPEQIQRYVDILKNMDPVDLHRVEEFKQRIADGSYQATVDELIDPLLDFLGSESDHTGA